MNLSTALMLLLLVPLAVAHWVINNDLEDTVIISTFISVNILVALAFIRMVQGRRDK